MSIAFYYMKIAQIAPLIERVPPQRYGGTERVVYELTEELVRRGHDVTLFASGDSITSAKLVSVYPRSLRAAKIENLYGANSLSMLNVGQAYQWQDRFDIIHDHTGFISLPTANISRVPVVVTYHGPFTPEATQLFRALKRPYLVSISKSQAKGLSGLNHVGHVYNGLTLDDYPFSEENDGYLLYVGRISLEKGVHHAIRAAQLLNLPLIIAAKLESIDIPYFRQYIEPHLSEDIRWVGEVDEKERNRLMSRARCFLHPVIFKEPFGLTLIEAMACGCPVVAFRQGAIPELVVHGKTGYVVNDLEGMIKAVERIGKINRRDCRLHAQTNFNASIMAERYEEIYRKILEKKGE